MTRKKLLLIGLGSSLLLAGFVLFAKRDGQEARADQSRSPGAPELPIAASVASSSPSSDPIGTLLTTVLTGDYFEWSEVATGRALGEQLPLIKERVRRIQTDTLRFYRRGPGWGMVEAKINTERGEQTAHLRFVERDGKWKLEHVRVARSASGLR